MPFIKYYPRILKIESKLCLLFIVSTKILYLKIEVFINYLFDQLIN